MKPSTLAVIFPVLLSGCSITLDDLFDDPDPYSPQVVYVQDYRSPVFFDPYYGQVKSYRPDVQLYESKTKKTKGDRVYEKTTVRNQYGRVVYENETSRKKKKKKK